MSDATKTCPLCGEQILAIARKCRYCGKYLDNLPRPIEVPTSALERALMPVGRPLSAIAAGYLALFAIIPLFGLPFAIGALWCGIVALRAIKAEPTQSGRGRAWFGIIVGGIMTLFGVIMLGAFIAAMFMDPSAW
jgi:hypothetical protein